MWYKKCLTKILTYLKNNWKGVLIVILAITLLFLLKREPKIKVVEKDNTDLLQELKQYKDRNGNLVSEITQLKLSKEEVKTRVDSLSKELKINKNKVTVVDHYVTTVDTTFKPKSIPVYLAKDTAYKVVQKDRWLNIEAIAGKDTGSIYFSLTDKLERIEAYYPGFLGFNPRTLVVLKTESPYIKYTEGYSFSIKEKTTWLTIGPAVTYDPFQNKWSVGVSAQIPIIKIRR